MANYYGTVVSRGGKIKKGSGEKIKEIIEKYDFGNDGELNVEVSDELQVWGYDSLYAYPKDDEERDCESFDTFLNEISQYLVEPLVISEVGNEKCKYVCAYAYIVKPNKKCVVVSLEDLIEKNLTNNNK